MKVKATAVVVELSFEKDFLTFLAQNGALEKFCTNFCNGRQGISSLLSNVDPYNWISSAFVWDDAKFWKELSDKWKEFISQPGISPCNVTFEVLDKDNSQKIWDNCISVYGGSLVGKYYEVADNSWNRKATDDDLQEVWGGDGKGWKDLIGGRYLILSDHPVEVSIEESFLSPRVITRQFIKVWVPEQECVQWVLYQGCLHVKRTKED